MGTLGHGDTVTWGHKDMGMEFLKEPKQCAQATTVALAAKASQL